MESMTSAGRKEWRKRGRERRTGRLEGRIPSCSQPGDFLAQTEARYWSENLSHCCRQDEKVLSADRVKPKLRDTSFVPRIHLELLALNGETGK